MAPLADPAALEAHLQRPVDPATAEFALAGASSAVRSWCGWELSREQRTFVVDGTGSTLLSLPTLYLVTVEAVRVEGLLLPEPDYTWSHTGQLFGVQPWPHRPRAVEVDAVHGYDPLPDVIRLVTVALASRDIANPERLRAATAGTVSRTFDMTELDMAMLAPFRIPLRP